MASTRFQFKKLRIALAWIGGVSLYVFSNSDDRSFRVGLPIVLAGEAIRLWASGYIEKKGGKLATDGPFAYVRNPLYAGNFLLGLGIVLISRNLWFMALFLVGFMVIYRGTVEKEEKDLEALFGDPYRRYLKEVPRFIPRLSPYPFREKIAFQWRLILKHREYVTLLGLAALLPGFYIWEEIILEGEFTLKHAIAAGVAFSFLGVVILERIFRDHFDPS